MPARVLLHVLLWSADTRRAGGVCFALLHVRVCALDRAPRGGGRGGGQMLPTQQTGGKWSHFT